MARRRSTGIVSASERGELDLAQAEVFTHRFGIGPLQGGAAHRLLFPAQYGTVLVDVGGKLLEDFVIRQQFAGLPGEK